MKNLKKLSIAGIMTLFLALSSCSNEPEIHSKVTYYANITINGETLFIMEKGDVYTELGAESTANGQTLPVTISGTVDANKTGMYKIKYTSINEDGFPASKDRTVLVMSPDPSTINLEGTFTRSGNSNNVTRISDRVYSCDNATGYTVPNDADITLTFYNIDDKQIYAPLQFNTSISGISAESNVGTIVDKDHWSWIIYASATFGPSVRAFAR